MRSPLTLLIQALLVICMLFFVTLFYASLKTICERRAVDCRQVPGVVVASQVISRQDRRGAGYCPQIVFTYEIERQRYEKISAHRDGKCFKDAGRAEQISSLYQPGREVTVFYTTENPGRGVLYTGVGRVTYFGAALSLIVCLCCGLLFKLIWRKSG